jgi:hypothetical protein
VGRTGTPASCASGRGIARGVLHDAGRDVATVLEGLGGGEHGEHGEHAHGGTQDERRTVAGRVGDPPGHDRAQDRADIAGHLVDGHDGAALAGHHVAHHRSGSHRVGRRRDAEQYGDAQQAHRRRQDR